MPTVAVPLYGPRRVQTEALPAARLTAAETPTSLGAGLAEAQAQRDQTIAGVAGIGTHLATEELTRAMEEERQKQDDLVDLANNNALAKATDDIAANAMQ